MRVRRCGRSRPRQGDGGTGSALLRVEGGHARRCGALDRGPVVSAIDAAADCEAEDEASGTRERNAAVPRMLDDRPAVVGYLRREILQLHGDGSLISRLVDLSRDSVDTTRAAGHDSQERDRVEQVVGVMVQRLGRLFLQPLVDQIVDGFPEGEWPAKAPELALTVAMAVRAGEILAHNPKWRQ